jgi:hypothetical protein
MSLPGGFTLIAAASSYEEKNKKDGLFHIKERERGVEAPT